ncbi:hypothetical protein RM530_17035 [Algiphilus sp. W345]|uniref:Uncharacterized protein n=1 Tax=Banduia mediterranea TaxID=3075609 RepID=A0ABU2WME6_9GAMM|nr:hypothetical protein [Algiphilus sp. W345]MDT0499050.1 hypothetical protein [Algiphilus sp. W345]
MDFLALVGLEGAAAAMVRRRELAVPLVVFTVPETSSETALPFGTFLDMDNQGTLSRVVPSKEVAPYTLRPC